MKEEKTIHFIADLTIQDCKNLQKIMGIKYSNKLKLLFTLSLILIALNII